MYCTSYADRGFRQFSWSQVGFCLQTVCDKVRVMESTLAQQAQQIEEIRNKVDSGIEEIRNKVDSNAKTTELVAAKSQKSTQVLQAQLQKIQADGEVVKKKLQQMGDHVHAQDAVLQAAVGEAPHAVGERGRKGNPSSRF